MTHSNADNIKSLKQKVDQFAEKEPEHFFKFNTVVTDIRYITDMSANYEGCILTLALFGPTIHLDTLRQVVYGQWGTDKYETHYESEKCNIIDQYWKVEYDIVRDIMRSE